MTTKSKFEITLDVFSENPFYVLERDLALCEGKLGAALKLYDSHLDFLDFAHYYARAFDEIISRINLHQKDFKPWLLLSRKVPSDSRVARHKKLWKSFYHSGVNLPEGKKSDEYIVESNDSVYFYGAILIENFDSMQIANIIGRGGYGCVAMTSNKKNEIDELLRIGWSYPEPQNYGFPKEIVFSAYYNEFFFLRPIGSFDDKEWGAVVLSQSSLIQKCFS